LAKSTNVIAAKAGIQFLPSIALAAQNQIPAFAGMTSHLLAGNPCSSDVLWPAVILQA
jgi:hypothetical protein